MPHVRETSPETRRDPGDPPDEVVGLVLAGGRSLRLEALGPGPAGKAGIEVGGEPCLVRVCRAVGRVTRRVIVVAAEGQPLPPLDAEVRIVRDLAPHAGPLAAIRDGLAAAGFPSPRWALLVAGDLPLLRAAVVRLLVDRARSSSARFVVPVVAGEPQVLLSVIACDLAGEIAPLAAAGRGPRALLDDLVAREPAAVRRVAAEELAAADPGLDSFLDLDTPEDLARIDSRGIPPSGA